MSEYTTWLAYICYGLTTGLLEKRINMPLSDGLRIQVLCFRTCPGGLVYQYRYFILEHAQVGWFKDTDTLFLNMPGSVGLRI